MILAGSSRAQQHARVGSTSGSSVARPQRQRPPPQRAAVSTTTAAASAPKEVSKQRWKHKPPLPAKSLTTALQRASSLGQLSQLWRANEAQFNGYHYAALIQQLAVLHEAVQYGVAPAGDTAGQVAQQARQSHQQPGSSLSDAQQQARAASLAELQAELGHLLGDGKGALVVGSDDDDDYDDYDEDDEQQQQTPWLQGPATAASTQQEPEASPQPSLQQQQQPAELQQPWLLPQPSSQKGMLRLARAVATAALQPGTVGSLDGRALVMLSLNLVRLGVYDAPLHDAVGSALGPQQLATLDAQQLCNLVWAMGCCSRAAAGRSSSSTFSLTSGGGVRRPVGAPRNRFQLPAAWSEAAAAQLLVMLPQCSDQGVAMAVWGFAQAGFTPNAAWWQGFWAATQQELPSYTPQSLALLLCALGKLQVQLDTDWLSACCTAACDALPGMDTQQLTMCLWGLGSCEARPHKAFTLLWFLTSMGAMGRASTQELSMWIYSLALLCITPSPTWCAAYVETSFGRLTAPDTSPQDLVTAMWSVSQLSWSPPLLYWRGLLAAAAERFDRCGPQDLANCISAAAHVDAGSVSEAWLQGFVKASQPRLSAFLPVQLANTADALATLGHSHSFVSRVVTVAWQAAFVEAAALQLRQGRFSARNLGLLAAQLRALRFDAACPAAGTLLADAEAALASMPHEATAGRGRP